MNNRRPGVCVFLFLLTTINYTDRVALSIAAKPISVEFGLSSVDMGYLFSSFLWMYVFCLIPVGILVDRFGGKAVNAGGFNATFAVAGLSALCGAVATLTMTRRPIEPAIELEAAALAV